MTDIYVLQRQINNLGTSGSVFLPTDDSLSTGEQHYRELIESLNDVIYTVNKDGVITYVSPVITTVAGFRPSEMVGCSFAGFLHKEDLSRAIQSFQRTLSGNLTVDTYRLIGKSGGVH